MTSQPQIHNGVPIPRRNQRQRRKQLAGLLFVSPALILVLTFFVIPLGMAFWMSLHNWPLLGKPRFIWFNNYTRLAQDGQFWASMRFTVYYTLVVTVAIFAVAFPLALFAEKSRKLTKIYRTAFFLPVVVGFGSASLLWAWLLDVDSGLFSPAAQSLGFTAKRVNLLADFDTTFWSIIIMVVWKTAGFNMIILLTGLQGISTEVQEAARMDGASAWQRFRRVTLPLMRRTIALALILSVSGSMLAFDQFYIIADGGPQNSTVTAVYWIFSQSFVSFHLGYGSALSMVLLVILVFISVLQLRLLRNPEGM
ncbi:carbohydrate ABC transporter permease [Phyllobacterium endophyticum]|uniref:Sugar ABC transporter permease n=1 Tax=Phyllobacterium endophyticum TaxID=1149773 RepID=A0A2P7AS39_9HYPH|nr:sugar ABC transporter permease [Phyllobacterium endophyticum]MBB3236770.1 multiple sugar transport system permease protein [Phyllobacterium endophyticum]PSH57046.1 sugar ABC transporter permease [Phyllobacterium endophyticum]TYR40325.1 sugar ABC transporter permease [Phyllobacterium endophyticum]